MTQKALMTLVLVAGLALLQPTSAWGVKLPNSPDDVKNLTDEELQAAIDHFDGTHGPGVRYFWAALQQSFDVRGPAEFEAAFPLLSEFLRRSFAASTAAGNVLAPQQGIRDACGPDGISELIDSVKYVSQAIFLFHFAHNQEAANQAEIAENYMRQDLEARCSDCKPEEIEQLLFLWIEIATDAAILAQVDASGNPEAQLRARFYLWTECLKEACERSLATGTWCRIFPQDPMCQEKPGDKHRCGTPTSPHIPTMPPPPGGGGPSGPPGGGPRGPSGGGGAGGWSSKSRLSPNGGIGASPSGLVCSGIFCDDETTVTDKYPRLPQRPPGDGKTQRPPAHGDFNPHDPTKGCFGPCCGRTGGGRGRHGDNGECWRDGVLVPCHMLF